MKTALPFKPGDWVTPAGGGLASMVVDVYSGYLVCARPSGSEILAAPEAMRAATKDEIPQ